MNLKIKHKGYTYTVAFISPLVNAGDPAHTRTIIMILNINGIKAESVGQQRCGKIEDDEVYDSRTRGIAMCGK